ALGVRVALDDFGTGYGSLSQLRSLPVDVLKIDRSFVAGLGTDHDDVIIATVAGMGESLGLTVVAEGIDAPHQIPLLRRRGVGLGQGFLFSPPVPLEWV